MRNKSNNWQRLGQGGFNVAYVNLKKNLVFKVVHSNDLELDTPERSVRLWNLINPHLRPKAKLATIKIDGETLYGWTCPYIKRQHSVATEGDDAIRAEKSALSAVLKDPELRAQEDQTIAKTVVDIYNRTGRVIADAPVVGNFVTTAQDQAVCIDIGMAVLLEQEENACLDVYGRRKSVISNTAWEQSHAEMRQRFLQQRDTNPLPETVATTNALLFIRMYRPDITNADFLLSNVELRDNLVRAFNGDHEMGKTLLAEIRPVNLISMKNSCSEHILRYIQSRGTLDEGKTFHASLMTKVFRNKLLIERKIALAQTLLNQINSASSVEEIQRALSDATRDEDSQKGWNSGFAACLGLCKIVSQIRPSAAPEQDSDVQHGVVQ